MTTRLTVLGVFALLISTGCGRPNRGYYWWDQTNDVWCYTYANGDTQCDTPSGQDDGDPGPLSGGGDNNNFGNSSVTGGDSVASGDTIPSDDGDSTNGDGDTTGGDTTGGDTTGGDTYGGGDTDTTPPPTPVCQDIGDGKRYCVVTDGDHICEFVYDADGNITGACAETGIDTVDHHGCTQSDQGGLICEFQTDAGDQCIVVFDSTGVVEFDPCHYFQAPTG